MKACGQAHDRQIYCGQATEHGEDLPRRDFLSGADNAAGRNARQDASRRTPCRMRAAEDMEASRISSDRRPVSRDSSSERTRPTGRNRHRRRGPRRPGALRGAMHQEPTAARTSAPQAGREAPNGQENAAPAHAGNYSRPRRTAHPTTKHAQRRRRRRRAPARTRRSNPARRSQQAEIRTVVLKNETTTVNGEMNYGVSALEENPAPPTGGSTGWPAHLLPARTGTNIRVNALRMTGFPKKIRLSLPRTTDRRTIAAP